MEQQKERSDAELIDKFSVLFPDPVKLKHYKAAVQFLVQNHFGLKKGKNQSVEEFELHCLLKYQFCEAMNIPIVFIGSTFVVNGKVGMEVDLLMFLVNKFAPEAEFELIQGSAKICAMRARKSPQHKWVAVKWTIEKAEAVVQGFSTKKLWEHDAEDMLNARCYGSLAKWICRKEIGGMANAFRSKEEIDNLMLYDEDEEEVSP